MNLKEIFDYREGRLIWRRKGRMFGKEAGCLMSNGYWQIMLNNKNRTRHRLVWEWHNGEIPEGLFIDHINRNKSDDRIENLRLSTPAQNIRNSKHSTGSSQYRGVSYCKRTKSYEAYGHLGRRKIHLGRFKTETQALIARNDFVKSNHGKFGCLQ